MSTLNSQPAQGNSSKTSDSSGRDSSGRSRSGRFNKSGRPNSDRNTSDRDNSDRRHSGSSRGGQDRQDRGGQDNRGQDRNGPRRFGRSRPDYNNLSNDSRPNASSSQAMPPAAAQETAPQAPVAAAKSFLELDFHPKIAAAITAANYETPTPIQAQAIPAVLQGKDVMGLAQTGTGKTAAFLLPLLQHLLTKGKPNFVQHDNKPVQNHRRYVRSLILVPTRELCEQVLESVKMLSGGLGLKACSVYGGVRIEGQMKNLRNGPEIVVACPGRLMDHIRRRTIDLSKVEFLVLDEADQMFDMGFMRDVKQIVSSVPRDRQTLMFSATMPPEIKRFAVEILKNPLTIQADKAGMAQTVSHTLYPCKEDNKSDLLLGLLEQCEEGSVLVFTRTKHRAKRLSERLEKARHSVTCLQGNLSQHRRREAMEGFRKGTYKIMVATDIAARGIDISSVSHVINFDIPDSVEAYTHRIGRTGRAAKTGSALTLITRQDEGMVRRIESVLKTKIKRIQIH